MKLRDTRLGRWVRRHAAIHTFIHGTWCRLIGPLDTRRVATSNTRAVNSSGVSVSTSTFFSVWATVLNVNFIFGAGGNQWLPIAPLQVGLTTQSAAVAWAKANVGVGIPYAVLDANQTIVSTGTGSNTTPPVSLPVVPSAAQPSQVTAALVTAAAGSNIGPIYTSPTTGAQSAVVIPGSNPLPSANYVQLLLADAGSNMTAVALVNQYANGDLSFSDFAARFNKLVYGT